MANQRLEQLDKQAGVFYSKGSPLLLEASALYLDHNTSNCIAQLKWRNIDQRPVKAVIVEIDGLDAFGQKTEPVHFQYDGLLVPQGSDFGGKTPILIRNNKVVKFDVVLKAVSFSDQTVWRADSPSILEPLPETKPKALEGEILDQYRRDLTKKGIKVSASYEPQKAFGLWQCGCGSWQHQGNECLKCKTTWDTLEEAADVTVLKDHLLEYKEEQERKRIEAEKRAEEARITREKAEAEKRAQEEEERREQEELRKEQEAIDLAYKKKKKRIILVTLLVMALIAVGGYLATFYFIPQSKYNDAVKMMEDGQYQDAYNAFSALGQFSDSSVRMRQVEAHYYYSLGSFDKVTEVYETLDSKYQNHAEDLRKIYEKAEDLLRERKYKEASDTFASLGNYNDAASRINEPYYIQAEALLAEKKYDAASNAFRTAGDYRDAADRVMEPYYVKAEDLLAEGKTDEASAAFAALGDYRDSVSRRWEPYAVIAAKLLEDGDYDSAASAYLALYERSGNTYKEAQTMAYECYYQKAADLEAKGLQDSALAVYESIPNYKESVLKSQAIHLSRGQSALDSMDLIKAREEFMACGENDDAKEQISKLDRYESAVSSLNKSNYSEARKEFSSIVGFLDSSEKLEICNFEEYSAAQKNLASGNIAKAYVLFRDLGEYNDSVEQADKMRTAYFTAREHLETEKYDEAITEFSALNDYADSQVQLRDAKYKKAASLFADRKYDEAIIIYEELGDYGDSSEKIKDVRYSKAEQLLEAGNKQEAESVLSLIPDYKDANEKLIALRTELGNEALKNKQYNISLSYYLGIPQTDEVKALEYKLAQTCYDDGNYEYATKAYELLGQYELSVTKLPVARYSWAKQLFESEKYAEAAEQFSLLGDSTDSATRAKESLYQLGIQQMKTKSYDDAKATFQLITGYSDAADMVKECDYCAATDKMQEGDYSEAALLFAKLGEYSDSDTQRKESIYLNASALLESKDYSTAEEQFASILGYHDSETMYKKSIYEQAEVLKKAGKYADAEKRYSELGEYEDSAKKITECIRLQADARFNVGDYAGAEAIYARIKNIDDNEARYKECRLLQGKASINTKDFIGALSFVEGLNYADSEALTGQCYSALGYEARTNGSVDEAVNYYKRAIDYPGVKVALYDIGKDYASTNQTEKAIQTLWLIRDQEDASNILTEIATIAKQSKLYELSALAYSSMREDSTVSFDFAEYISYDRFLDLLSECNLLPEENNYKSYAHYQFACKMRDCGFYDVAITAFTTLGDYSDSKAQIYETTYLTAEKLEKSGDQEAAYQLFIGLGEFKDSFERANKPYYDLGVKKRETQEWDASVAAFEKAGVYSDASTQILITRFDEGMAKYESGDWDGAIKAFTSANQYSNAEDMILETKYCKAVSFMNASNLETAISLFTEIKDYSDASTKLQEVYYAQGIKLQGNKKYREAIDCFKNAKGYHDSKEKIEEIRQIVHDRKMDRFTTKGGIVSFGVYEQNNNFSDDKEKIEWLVLATDKSKALLLSRYGLRMMYFKYSSSPYDKTPTWEESVPRELLNNQFIKDAFTVKEKGAIMETKHDGVTDKVFLLSKDEVQKYIPKADERKLRGTAYARSGVYTGYGYKDYLDKEYEWWTRSVKSGKQVAFVVDDDGQLIQSPITTKDVLIRPALWIDLSADYFWEVDE